ncbi:unnamed protein product, partial [Chrysoparadoxa australica]
AGSASDHGGSSSDGHGSEAKGKSNKRKEKRKGERSGLKDPESGIRSRRLSGKGQSAGRSLTPHDLGMTRAAASPMMRTTMGRTAFFAELNIPKANSR